MLLQGKEKRKKRHWNNLRLQKEQLKEKNGSKKKEESKLKVRVMGV